MKRKSGMSGRDIFMVVFLVLLLGGVAYYLGFYKPMVQEMSQVNAAIWDTEDQINVSVGKVARMEVMQAELDEIFSRPQEEITEIAPYDNKEVVLNELNGILQASEGYNLTFAEPNIQDNGAVRRNVTMNFTCADYESAKTIIENLNRNHWRCMVSNLSVLGSGDIMEDGVTVSATITFFESTKLS